MLDGATNPDVRDLISGHAREQAAPSVKRMLYLGAAVIAGLVVVAALTVFLIVESREKEIVTNVEHRAKIAVSGHTAVLATWLEGLAQLAGNLTESGLFRLFAAEVDLAGTSTALPGALKEQLPYMQLAVNEFAEQSGITGAYMIGRDGRVYLANATAPALTPDQRRAAQAVFETGAQTVLPLAVAKDGLQLNILFPVTPPQVADPKDARRTVGVMLVATPASSKIAEIMVSGPLAQEGEYTRFFQMTAQGSEEIVPWKTPFRRAISSSDIPSKPAPLTFAARPRIGGGETVFSSGIPVANAPWLVVREVDAATALAPLTTYRLVGGGLALLTTVLIAAAFIAVWWRQTGVYNQALALQFQNLAAQIQAQRQLLDSINNSIEEQIGLKNLDGRYSYANPAFTRAVGRDLDEVIDLSDTAIFGEDTARRLSASDKRVLRTGAAEIIEEELDLLDRRRCLTISNAPLRDDDDNIIGIVSVARDVTEQIEHQQKMKQAIDATIAALVHTVEMHDPYLAGHSNRMCEIGREIGQRLSLDDEHIATLEMAANLSQIGKLSIPESLLTKKARLTPVEEVVVQGHIQRTEDILKEIDFGLPVCGTVAQMHERLDGTGYPRGLRNDEIDLLGRIIGAVDVYCARIEPRGYRATITSREALDILEDNPEKYDTDVIAALRQYVDETVKEPAVT